MEAIREWLSQIHGLLLSLGQTISVWDILDILIITFLIYRILSFMRKTSASSVMKGLVMILGVAWLASFSNMSVLSYLLNQVMQMAIVVVVVLFQPEIRKLFERMGSSRLNLLFKKRGRIETIETAIRNVVVACEAMAKGDVGAIIVFERDVGLNDYAVTGTRVDARISPELTQNIFFPNSPLHDGALIVREGRMLAAACMLPLSNNASLSRELGMRHRAGVGISERSDAVVVIVSEESGSISVAIDGMLKRHLSRDTLEKLLNNEVVHSDGDKAAKAKRGGKIMKKGNM